MVEIKTHMDHYLFTTGLKQRPVGKVANHVPPGLSYSVNEISNNQVSSYIYQILRPENQDKVTAGFHQLLPVCKYWTDRRLLWKANFLQLSSSAAGFLKKPRGFRSVKYKTSCSMESAGVGQGFMWPTPEALGAGKMTRRVCQPEARWQFSDALMKEN